MLLFSSESKCKEKQSSYVIKFRLEIYLIYQFLQPNLYVQEYLFLKLVSNLLLIYMLVKYRKLDKDNIIFLLNVFNQVYLD